jgi:hypothetical protein
MEGSTRDFCEEGQTITLSFDDGDVDCLNFQSYKNIYEIYLIWWDLER